MKEFGKLFVMTRGSVWTRTFFYENKWNFKLPPPSVSKPPPAQTLPRGRTIRHTQTVVFKCHLLSLDTAPLFLASLSFLGFGWRCRCNETFLIHFLFLRSQMFPSQPPVIFARMHCQWNRLACACVRALVCVCVSVCVCVQSCICKTDRFRVWKCGWK